MATRGWPVGLVSGGFIEIVGPLAARLGITLTHANRLEVLDGHLTGRVDGDVVDRAAKAVTLREYAARVDVPMSRTIAIGDGANDIDMVTAGGLRHRLQREASALRGCRRGDPRPPRCRARAPDLHGLRVDPRRARGPARSTRRA